MAIHKRILNTKLSKKRKLLKNLSNDSDIKDCVLNLSSCPISANELSVLSKGLTFIPKPKHMDIRDLFKDTKQFVSKMRTRYETFNQPQRTKSPFYRPKPHRSMVTNHIGLENTIYKILLETESIEYTQTKKDNLTRNQRIALANLSKRTDIVINKADKGSTIVVQDIYIERAIYQRWTRSSDQHISV